MSNQSEAPKETPAQDWSSAATPAPSLDQSEQSGARAGDTQDQTTSGAQGVIAPEPILAVSAPVPTPVPLTTASLPHQPLMHVQMASQMISGATTSSAMQTQLANVSQQGTGQQTFQLTTAQGTGHQTIQYGSTMSQAAEQQTAVHIQSSQSVMAHGAGQQTIQLGLGQSLLAHSMGQQTIQGLVAQGGQVFGGTQIICSSDPNNSAQMESGTMACQQYLTSQGLTGPQFVSVPQLQVIQAAPNQFIQQQFMYQNMSIPTALHTVQNTSVGQQMNQGRPTSVDSKTPSILPAGPQLSQQQNVAIRIALTNSYAIPTQTTAAKGMAAVIPQQLFGQKQLTQQKQQATPLMFGVQQPTILQSVRQAGSGPISFGPVQQAQIISNPTQIRFATAPNFIGSTGQIIGTNQTLVNLGQFQTVPIMQPLMATQGTTILGSQPLYIRTADTVQPQQQQGIMGNVQPVAPTRHVANIAPQTIRPSATPPSRRGVQVQPNNALASNPQPTTPNSRTSSTPAPQKSSNKLTTVAKLSLSTAATTKLSSTPSVSMVLRPPSQSGTLPARSGMTGAPLPTVAVQPKPQVSSKTEETKAEEKAAALTKEGGVPAGTMEKCGPATKEELASPSAKTLVVLPTTVEKASDVKTNGDDVKKSDEKLTNSIKSAPDKENKVMSKPVREKVPKKSKPRILTHIIEGFIIQEAMEPFPVNRSSLMSQFLSPTLAIPDEKTPLTLASQFEDDSEDEEDEKEQEEEEENPSKRPRIEPAADEETLEKDSPKPDEEPEVVEETTAPVQGQDAPPTPTTLPSYPPKLTCEFCGKTDIIQNFARSKRFCSVTCSKRYSAYSQRKQSENGGNGKGNLSIVKGCKRSQPVPTAASPLSEKLTGAVASLSMGSGSSVAPGSVEYSSDTDRSISAPGRQEESLTPCSPPDLERVDRMDTDEFGDVIIPANKHLSQWGVQDVYNFIRTLPGCGMYADEFRQQEIDGQALMLLKEDHLMTTLNVKLGPALKICARINTLKD